jgi:hypothetical protein
MCVDWHLDRLPRHATLTACPRLQRLVHPPMNAPGNKIFLGFSAAYPDHYSPGKTQPTIVFFGSPDMFAKFARWLEERSNRAEGSERLNDAAFFSNANVDVLLTFLTRSRGMRQVDEHTLEWGLAPREIDTFSAQLQSLAKSPPGETRWVFLDCPGGDKVHVVAQVGEDEYPRSAFT